MIIGRKYCDEKKIYDKNIACIIKKQTLLHQVCKKIYVIRSNKELGSTSNRQQDNQQEQRQLIKNMTSEEHPWHEPVWWVLLRHWPRPSGSLSLGWRSYPGGCGLPALRCPAWLGPPLAVREGKWSSAETGPLGSGLGHSSWGDIILPLSISLKWTYLWLWLRQCFNQSDWNHFLFICGVHCLTLTAI